MGQVVAGKSTVATLAERFPQLYVAPAEDAQEAYKQASTRGIKPKNASLGHFMTSDEDELREVETPAGPVEVLFLRERADFETFLQIIGHRAQPVPIAPTVGATTYRGLADWGAVIREYVAYTEAGGTDWSHEFVRLAKEPGRFRAELIVISEGPYSNIAANQTEFAEGEWLRVSREIRLHHECAHVVCRRLMPEDILPVWDEITADVTGLLCATRTYDPELAAVFLGVTATGYAHGRLEEYLDEESLARIDPISAEVYTSMQRIAQLRAMSPTQDPFDFLLRLKRDPLIVY